MGRNYDGTKAHRIDFSKNERLTDEQKKALENIQENFLPIERATYLADYKEKGLITEDEFSELTGIPYVFGSF